MSVKSKFYQVTNQILLEYQTDQYEMTSSEASEDKSTFYEYQGMDGKQYVIDTKNLSHWKLMMEDGTYYYPGRNVTEVKTTGDETNTTIVGDQDFENVIGHTITYNARDLGYIIKDNDGNEERTSNYFCDKIRLYFLSGYVMNSLAGISLQVKGKVNLVKEVNGSSEKRMSDYITLIDWIMPKELLKDDIQWRTSPLYLNSKFYDRYIEISVPAPYSCAINMCDVDYVYEVAENATLNTYRGNISQYSDIIVNFATVQPQYLTLENEDDTSYASLFTLDANQTLAIKMESNSDNFNVCLYEDKDTNTIMYYPVYGEGESQKDFDLDVMYAIESGNIPMLDLSEYDSANEGMDDFIDMYGEDVNRWVIINELSITYNYEYIIMPNSADTTPVSINEYYTNTIDYTGKSDEHGSFWRSKFVPYIKQRNNMTCRSIVIEYTCHLYNRMNNMDIIRKASMVVSDPYKYNSHVINTSNITQYKIVNKINKTSVQAKTVTSDTKERYIRSYYDVTNLVVKDVESGNMYTQGKMTLYLKHTSSNYMLRLYTLNDNNVRIPYDLSGATNYKLVFPNINSKKIEIKPNADSTNYNLGIGSLVFYISEAQVAQIMNVPTSDRYFALMVDDDSDAQNSTLYEGSVEYYTNK